MLFNHENWKRLVSISGFLLVWKCWPYGRCNTRKSITWPESGLSLCCAPCWRTTKGDCPHLPWPALNILHSTCAFFHEKFLNFSVISTLCGAICVQTQSYGLRSFVWSYCGGRKHVSCKEICTLTCWHYQSYYLSCKLNRPLFILQSL